MPGEVDRMDNTNEEEIDFKKKVKELENTLEETKKKVKELENTLEETKNRLNKTINFLSNISTIIDDKTKLYMATLNSEDLKENSQNNSDETNKIEDNEEVKENKLDISKVIKAFSQKFDFINEDEFNVEMENDEMLKKFIESIKRIFGLKNSEIDGLKIEIAKKGEKNNSLEKDINKLNEDINKLNNEKIELENNLENKKKEITRLEGVERDLTDKKNRLNQENKKKEQEIEEFRKKCDKKEKKLTSIGNLLQARELYDKYLLMETRVLSKLENVLIQRDFESFISSGYNLSSLDNIWDIVKIEYKNISNEDKEILKEVFAFFLNQINKRFKDAKYGLVQAEVGEEFDAVEQVDLSQNSRGKVIECVFYGYGFLEEKENPDDEDIITRVIKNPLVLTT